MLQYNEIKKGRYVVLNGEPHEVLDSHVFRKQQRKPVNAVRLKNLLTGKVIEHSFHQSDKAAEAEIQKQDAVFLYEHRGEFWFAAQHKSTSRFQLDADLIGGRKRFMKTNSSIELLTFDGRIIDLRLPVKVALKVTGAPPAVRGNTAQGGIKTITLETGAVINAPMFVNEGDTVIVNTETGEYVGRS